MTPKDWVKVPTVWIKDGGLRNLKWSIQGANASAALMVLVCLAHHADPATGEGKATYAVLTRATGMSRTMVARGLDLLVELGLIERPPEERSAFKLAGFAAKGWGKLPAKSMYEGPEIAAFHHFNLRSMVELYALK